MRTFQHIRLKYDSLCKKTLFFKPVQYMKRNIPKKSRKEIKENNFASPNLFLCIAQCQFLSLQLRS